MHETILTREPRNEFMSQPRKNTHARHIQQSLEAATVYFTGEFSLQLVECDIACLESLSELLELIWLHELVLVEFLGILLQLAGSSSLCQEIFVAVLNLLIRLASPVVEQVAGQREETSYEPQVVVAADKASIHGDASTDCGEEQSGIYFPGVQSGRVLHSKRVDWSVARAKCWV